MRQMTGFIMLLLTVGMLAGCATVGSSFPKDYAAQIIIGQTTRPEVEGKLGSPFRTGSESGDPTATYLYYNLGVFTTPVTQDLTVRYGHDGKVKSYTYNSN
jgi:hypothetical protein